MTATILVTGGTGYIGSHAVVQLLALGVNVVILDDLCNSKTIALNRIEMISGKKPDFIEGSISESEKLQHIFTTYKIDSVIHFAGLKAVGESELEPLKYYSNNVSGSIVLFNQMAKFGVKKIVFSSSATVYGDPGCSIYREDTSLSPVNVYGRTKLMVENILRDIKLSDSNWRIAILRYFNPVGAHHSGLIGEDPLGIPNNLMPYITQVAVGKREYLSVFGGDYPTSDGTGRRDYIHVDDLAAGHLAALQALNDRSEIITCNLGTGRSYSVLEIIAAFEKASGKKIAYKIVDKRPGDLAEYYADTAFAHSQLDWRAKYGIERMCEDAWRWQLMNPNGYEK